MWDILGCFVVADGSLLCSPSQKRTLFMLKTYAFRRKNIRFCIGEHKREIA